MKEKSSREDAGKQKEETYNQRQHAMIQQRRIEHAVTARTEQLRMDTEKAQMDAEEAILAKDKAAQKVQREAVMADLRAKTINKRKQEDEAKAKKAEAGEARKQHLKKANIATISHNSRMKKNK